jgi:hypothetical protein
MWIIMACQHISRKVTVKGVKKCCMSNAVDENDDSMLCNDSEEIGNVWSEYEEDEGTDCEMGTATLIMVEII